MSFVRGILFFIASFLLVSTASAGFEVPGPGAVSKQRLDSVEEGFSPLPLEEEKSCCDLCFEALEKQGEQPGGRVCCCEDDSGDVVPQACSFADKYPNAWPPGLGQDLLDECLMEHEEGHIEEGEGVCTNIADGQPSVWGRGQTPETCEPNQYEEEIKCLEDADCGGDSACETLIQNRIKQMEDLLEDLVDDDDDGA